MTLTDQQWDIIQQLIPSQLATTALLMTEVCRGDVHNIMINDIALGYSTDTPWQDLPDRYHRIKDVIMVVSNN
jgi:transposase